MIKLKNFHHPKAECRFFSARVLIFFVIFLLAMETGLNPVRAHKNSAPTDTGALVADAPNTESMPENVKECFGCFIAGSLATATTAAIGAENLVNLVAGGIVGVVFSSFCVIGQGLYL